MDDVSYVYIVILYALFAFCVVFPPTELLQLGLSIQSIFSSVLGSEELYFVYHHIVRVLLTLCIHSLLPLGFYIALGFYDWSLNLFEINKINIYWKVYLLVSISIPIGVFTLCYYWYFNEYENHPIVKKLKNIAQLERESMPRTSTNQSDSSATIHWRTIANRINTEFRSVDKFSTGSVYRRLYVTHNWLVRVTLYDLDVVSLSNLQFTLTHANDVKITQDGNVNAQILNILVKPINGIQKPFIIHFNSLEYKDFKDKVQSPIHEACNVIIRQSLPDLFMDSFMQQVNENPSVKIKRDDVEQCIGCMRKLADAKLIKRCDELDVGECKQCFCRPMWCLECMGKWFAYRQDQEQPHTWLSSRATCATCRATFCMLDVTKIEFSD